LQLKLLRSKLAVIRLNNKYTLCAFLYSINSNLLKARSIELDRISEARYELDEVIKEKIAKVEQEIAQKHVVLEEQRRDNESVAQNIAELREMVSAEDAKKFTFGSTLRKQESILNHYLDALHSLKNNIQDHVECKRILLKLFDDSREWSTSQRHSNAFSDATGSSETTLKLVEMMNELDQLKAEDTAMALKHKDERQKQVEQNAKLLEQIAMKKTTQKTSSGQVANGILVKNNATRIQALGDTKLR
jgi:hypothetical protein